MSEENLHRLKVDAVTRLDAFWREFDMLDSAGVVPSDVRDMCQELERAAMLYGAVLSDLAAVR